MDAMAPTRAPTGRELAANPVVKAAIDAAWTDSRPNNADERHEEGGWIYMNKSSGEISTARATPGYQTEINLANPPHQPGYVVVGVFHTHPNPSAEGWDPGPSRADRLADEQDGIPDLIRADNGIHYSGPESRRGGLVGGPGFPPKNQGVRS